MPVNLLENIHGLLFKNGRSSLDVRWAGGIVVEDHHRYSRHKMGWEEFRLRAQNCWFRDGEAPNVIIVGDDWWIDREYLEMWDFSLVFHEIPREYQFYEISDSKMETLDNIFGCPAEGNLEELLREEEHLISRQETVQTEANSSGSLGIVQMLIKRGADVTGDHSLANYEDSFTDI